ncbi:MAG: MBL fold metallo-hydrolase [Christensenellaceae bacterium]
MNNLNHNSITLIANAGVLIQYNGVAVLIDALHTKKTIRFSRPPEDVLQDIVDGNGAFKKIDLMLITHAHIDHYSPKEVGRFMERHPETMLITPTGDDFPASRTMRLQRPHEEHTAGRIQVSCRRIVHDGKDYADYVNYGYRIVIDGKVFTVFGDATKDREGIARLTENMPVDVAIVNFPFVSLRENQAFLRDVVGPERIVAMHLPFPEDDGNSFIRTTRRALERPGGLQNVTMLYNRLERAEL